MRMTPEEKKTKERIEIYKLYLNYGIRDKSLTDEEVNKLIQTHLFLWHEAPSPSPLPAGERDGVRGDSVERNEI
jgi:hypothetical protein